MHDLIEQHRAAIALLCRHHAVRRLAVFGSAARGTDFDPDRSDADFLVESEPASGLVALERHLGLAECSERPVDLVERDAVEESRNYIRRRQILASAEAVYGCRRRRRCVAAAGDEDEAGGRGER